jgi:DNA-binding MarR family transcriptional regulator
MARKSQLGEEGAPKLEHGILTSLVGFHLRQAQIAVFRDFTATTGSLDVSPGIFAVLVLIEGNAGLKQSELAKGVHLDRSTVVSVIDKLERRGLVDRHAVANDRRSNALRLTAQGAALLKQLKRRVASHEKRLARDLTAAEKATLVVLLQRVFPEHR